MVRLLPSLFFSLTLVLTACTGDGFDENAFPPDQEATRLAYLRLAKHGELEPVLEVGQQLTGWQFRVTERTAEGLTLADRSGINYFVPFNASSPEALRRAAPGMTGTVTARVVQLDRDLVAARIDAVLDISASELWKRYE